MNRICLKTILTLTGGLTILATAASGATPVTPNASPEARALLNFVYQHDLALTRDELPDIMDYLAEEDQN